MISTKQYNMHEIMDNVKKLVVFGWYTQHKIEVPCPGSCGTTAIFYGFIFVCLNSLKRIKSLKASSENFSNNPAKTLCVLFKDLSVITTPRQRRTYKAISMHVLRTLKCLEAKLKVVFFTKILCLASNSKTSNFYTYIYLLHHIR